MGKDKTVKLYHVGYWYYIYGNDAKIVAFLTGYKLYDNKCGIPSVGFPEYSLDKVLNCLAGNKINYSLPNDENRRRDYGDYNRYDRFLTDDLPFSYVNNQNNNKKYSGKFTIKFNDEPEETFIIGKNVNSDAKIVDIVFKHNIGNTFELGEDKVVILSKEIDFK